MTLSAALRFHLSQRVEGKWCAYCAAPAETWDHVEPYSKSRTNHTDNLLPACKQCNEDKADRPLLVFLALSHHVDSTDSMNRGGAMLIPQNAGGDRQMAQFPDINTPLRDDDYIYAANRLQSPTLDVIARDGGLVQAYEFRPRLVSYRVSSRAMRDRQKFGGGAVPWGWTILPEVYADGRRDVWFVGPWWLMWPRVLRSWWQGDAMSTIVAVAVEIGLARLPYEACYYHEVEWFPEAPRFE